MFLMKFFLMNTVWFHEGFCFSLSVVMLVSNPADVLVMSLQAMKSRFWLVIHGACGAGTRGRSSCISDKG